MKKNKFFTAVKKALFEGVHFTPLGIFLKTVKNEPEVHDGGKFEGPAFCHQEELNVDPKLLEKLALTLILKSFLTQNNIIPISKKGTGKSYKHSLDEEE